MPDQSVPAQELTGFSVKNAVNLVRNPGFEQTSYDQKRPKYWYPIYGIQSIASPALAEFKYALDDADGGERSAAIQSSEQVPKQPYWTQIVPIKGGAQYRLSARIKAANCLRATLSRQLLDRDGARIWDRTAVGPTDTRGEWKEVSLDLQTPVHATELKIRCGMNATGKVWFDEISLVEIAVPRHQPFQGATYPCVKIHTQMQMDGKLDEWNGIEDAGIAQVRTLAQPDQSGSARGWR